MRKQPKNIYRISWLGVDPQHNYEKYFPDYKGAYEFASNIQQPLMLKLENEKKGGLKWVIAKNEAGQELINNTKIKRKIQQKYSKIVGNNSEVITTVQYAKSQRNRLANGLVVAPALIYIGGKYALPGVLRVVLVGIGVVLGYNNLSKYYINYKLHKDSGIPEEVPSSEEKKIKNDTK